MSVTQRLLGYMTSNGCFSEFGEATAGLPPDFLVAADTQSENANFQGSTISSAVSMPSVATKFPHLRSSFDFEACRVAAGERNLPPPPATAPW